MRGSIAKWDARKACGWVLGEDSSEYFAHKSEFAVPFGDGEGPAVGAPVTFNPGIDAKSGKPRALQIDVPGGYSPAPVEPAAMQGGCAALGGGAFPTGCLGYSGCGGYGGFGGCGPKGGGQYMQPMQMEQQGLNSGMERLRGAIAKWDINKACGWIKCPSMPDGQIFAHKSEFLSPFPDNSPPPLGTSLTFVAAADPKSGAPRAKEIMFEGGRPMTSAAALGMASRMPMMLMQQPQPMAMGKGGGRLGGPARYSGVIGEWTPEKGCGWVDCDDPTVGRIFAHKSEFIEPVEDMNQPTAGMLVTFMVGMDKKSGKGRALEIQVDLYGGEPGRYAGTLVLWDASKACGWIETNEVQGLSRGQIFAHKTEFEHPFAEGEDPQIGTVVSFVTGLDRVSGKIRARSIRMGPYERPPATQEARKTGILESWDACKACGWISSSDVTKGQIFAHKSEFEVPFGDHEQPAIGTPVNFLTGCDKVSGKVRARAIRIDDGRPHVEQPAFGSGPALGSSLGGDLNGGNGTSSRQLGALTEWDSRKACGWIRVHGGQAKFFAHKTEFETPFQDGEEPLLGSPLSFVPGHDSVSGKVRATQIRPEDPSVFGVDSVAPPAIEAAPEEQVERMAGYIEAWDPRKACGWIHTHDGNKFFAHKTEFEQELAMDPEAGATVTFVPGRDPKSGKVRARAIWLDYGMGMDGPPLKMHRHA